MKVALMVIAIIYVYFNGYWEEQTLGVMQAMLLCDLLIWANKQERKYV